VVKILRPVLRLLEELYGFPGAQKGAPEEIDLALGIQPVHDLSRMAAIGAASNHRESHGYWLASAFQTFGGAPGSLNENLNLVSPAVRSEGYTLDEATQWAWVIDVWATSDVLAGFNLIQVLIRGITNDFFIGPSPDAPSSTDRLIYRSVAASATNTNVALPTTNNQVTFPALILSPQDGLRFEANAVAPAVIVFTENVLLWIGKRGTFPPGYA